MCECKCNFSTAVCIILCKPTKNSVVHQNRAILPHFALVGGTFCNAHFSLFTMKRQPKKKSSTLNKGTLHVHKKAASKRSMERILPQCSIGQLKRSQGGNKKTNYNLNPMTVPCWAHSRSGKRCSRMVQSREGEPIPIPYCDVHMKSGDGAIKVVSHPFAGKCLVAR